MIAKLLQDVDSLERLGFRTAKQSFDLRGRNEEAVELKLEVRQAAEHDLFIFDWHCRTWSLSGSCEG